MYYLISFMAPLFYAISVVTESFLSVKIFKHPIVMLFFVSLTNALFMPFILFFKMPTIPDLAMLPFYLMISIIDVAYLYPYYVAFKKTDTSIISSLFALGKIFVPIISFFLLQESLTLSQYLGFVVIILSSLFLNYDPRVKFKINSAFYWMFLSSFLLAVRICLVKLILQSENNVANVLIYPNLLSGLIPFSFMLWKKNRQEIKNKICIYKKKFKFFTLIEFVTFLAVCSSTIAVNHLSPTICTAIEATEPLFVWIIITIVSSIFSYQFMQQKNSLKKIFCFLTIIGGVILTCL